ncbi:hypothetical protein ACFXHA_33485 [Nocardia sp. NPDC059240]|uniref:hypothetical protein n=1 Tax=Nocardia sp. NPDC059240 TaxID=3346786 RepID=UPI0036AF31D2
MVDCIVDDPRWDHQVEHRSWLYASLVAELGVDLQRFRAAYAGPADPMDDSNAWLAVGVLEDLARAGIEGSVSELRHYLRTRRDTYLALNALLPFHDRPEARGLLDEVLAVADDDDLRRAIDDCAAMPWPQWRAESARIERVLMAEEQCRRAPEPRPTPRAVRAAAERERILDVAVDAALIQPVTATDLSDAQWEATLLAIAPVLLEDAFTPLRVRIAVRRHLRQLRSPRALAWARANAGMDTDFAFQALSLLCEIGEGSDAARLSDYLVGTRTASDDDIYAQCTLVSGLTRLAYAPAVPMFESLFDTTVYSYLRERCARGLSLLSMSFAHDRAFECLTDAESGIRAIGIAQVDLSRPQARERLTRIARDAMEDEDNRRAAAVRKI